MNCIVPPLGRPSSLSFVTARSNNEITESSMSGAASSATTDFSRRIVQLQVLTIVWMTVEALVSLGAAWRAHSPTLFGFGGDSLIELLSAAIVLWRFRFGLNESRAAKSAGILLFVLAGLVMLTSTW